MNVLYKDLRVAGAKRDAAIVEWADKFDVMTADLLAMLVNAQEFGLPGSNNPTNSIQKRLVKLVKRGELFDYDRTVTGWKIYKATAPTKRKKGKEGVRRHTVDHTMKIVRFGVFLQALTTQRGLRLDWENNQGWLINWRKRLGKDTGIDESKDKDRLSIPDAVFTIQAEKEIEHILEVELSGNKSPSIIENKIWTINQYADWYKDEK